MLSFQNVLHPLGENCFFFSHCAPGSDLLTSQRLYHYWVTLGRRRRWEGLHKAITSRCPLVVQWGLCCWGEVARKMINYGNVSHSIDSLVLFPSLRQTCPNETINCPKLTVLTALDGSQIHLWILNYGNLPTFSLHLFFLTVVKEKKF